MYRRMGRARARKSHGFHVAPGARTPVARQRAQILLPLPQAPLAINRGIGLQGNLAAREESECRQLPRLIVQAETEVWASHQQRGLIVREALAERAVSESRPQRGLIVRAETEVWATRPLG
jgi:hypothetical protein